MRLLGFILLLSITLAALKVALAVLVVGYLIVLMISAVTKPAETFGALAFFVLLSLIERHPLICLGLAGAIILVGWIQRQDS